MQLYARHAAFGKGEFVPLDTMKVNEALNLAVYCYYREGTWDMF